MLAEHRYPTMVHVGSSNSNWRGGMSKHPLYERYLDMIGRCYRVTHARYQAYGGRGIRVCDRWRESFWNYVEDLGERPNDGQRWTVDRINNDGDYEPSNCRWATYTQQARNKRGYGDGNSRRDPATGRFSPRR